MILPSISDLKFDIVRKGTWIKGLSLGPGHIPNIIYPLAEKNVFIVGIDYGNNVKMVKIRVTGITTFDWLEARNVEPAPEECKKQSTFNESCFTGQSFRQSRYDVDLVATIVGTKGITQSYF